MLRRVIVRVQATDAAAAAGPNGLPPPGCAVVSVLLFMF
jgi:hypothetical protein